MNAISECAKCTNFENQHLHSLLKPIIHRHLFELFIGDYLTLPKVQGYHIPGVYLNTFSQYV